MKAIKTIDIAQLAHVTGGCGAQGGGGQQQMQGRQGGGMQGRQPGGQGQQQQGPGGM